MNDLSQFKTDHLFLLIGSNPLPNYVAARLLANSKSHLYFVHTKDTYGIAQKLTASLQQYVPGVTYIQVDNAEAKQIFDPIRNVAEKCVGTMGLHYTGGTKAMAVHAYQAIQAARPDAVFSYLNAENLELIIDQAKKLLQPYPVGSLEVQLTIEQLLELHGATIDPKEPITTAPSHLELCRSISKIPGFGKWCFEYLKETKNNSKRDFKNITKLEEVILPADEAFAPLRFYQGESDSLSELATKTGLKIDKLAKFLDGIWLEHYALWGVQQAQVDSQIQYSGLNIKPKGKRVFEFDVIAIRGYQLFALSCTTYAKKSDIKLKLFEAYVRAKQMGGDEARVAVICYAPKNDPDNNPHLIQNELEESWHEFKNIIRVFGEEHLPDLPEHLKRWFDQT